MKENLEQDDALVEHTPLKLITSWNFSLFVSIPPILSTKSNTTNKHTEQLGSPVSSIVGNLYMERFQTRALATALHSSSAWYRYVDDTFVLIHEYNIEELTTHINSLIDTKI